MHYNIMELIKKAREVGTSAGVLLPRSWLNKQVVVTLLHPTKEKILSEIMAYLIDKNLAQEVKGIYLYGSYARDESQPESDIDVLVITQQTNSLIKEGDYEILLVSEESFAKNLSHNLAYLSILQEAQALLNKGLLDSYSSKKITPQLSEHLKEIRSIIKINEETVNLCKEQGKRVPPGIVYSVILRLREIYIIKSLKSKKGHTYSSFVKFIPEGLYTRYTNIKRNKKEETSVDPTAVMALISLSKKWLKEVNA